MRTRLFVSFITMVACLCFGWSCQKEIEDKNENVYAMVLSADSVFEGDDVPVELTLDAAGLSVDNSGWGDPWKAAVFNATVKDSYGRLVENAVWSSPNGLIKNGSRIDLPEKGKVNFVLSGLRQGLYNVVMNLETRYTIDTWASCSVKVKHPAGKKTDRDVLVDSFTMPDDSEGVEIDEEGNVVLDLRVFNEERPFYYECAITPANATNTGITARSTANGIVDVRIENKHTLVLIPKMIGTCRINADSVDGNAHESVGVRVIRTQPSIDGFTLPLDPDGGDGDAILDAGGRIALDINDYPNGSYYEFVCRPIPSTAGTLTLTASSNAPDVARATIVNGNVLRIFPEKVGYAVVTVSKSDGTMSRKFGVAVISRGKIRIGVVEGERSAEDALSGVFPCKLTFAATTKYLPNVLVFDTYGKVNFRADLTDPAEHFVEETLKNSRTAFKEFEEDLSILYLPGISAYNIYERLMLQVAGTSYLVHFSADWPNNKDYYVYAMLYKIYLKFSIRQNYDTNLYRIELVEEYNSPENKIYQYL